MWCAGRRFLDCIRFACIRGLENRSSAIAARFRLSRAAGGAIDELEAKVALDHAQVVDRYRLESIDSSIDASYDSGNPSSYRQNKEDVEFLFNEILKSNDAAAVNGILQNWLKQLGVKYLSQPNDEEELVCRNAVPYEEAVSVANGLIREFGERGSLQLTMQVLDWMNFQNWFKLDPHLKVHIIDILGKSSCFDIAIQVFNHFINISLKKDAGLYNAMLHAFNKASRPDAVLELFKEMKESAIKPNVLTYNLVMHSCVKAGEQLTTVVGLFKDMYLKGIKPDIYSYNILISACVDGKQAREARIFFDNMKKRGLKPNVVIYSTLISVYAASGNCEAAIGVLQEMVEAQCKPNSITFGSLIHGLGREGHIEEAEKMFRTMKEIGAQPTASTYNIMINMYSKSGNHELAQSSFHEMVESDLEPTCVTFTSLMYCFKSIGAYKETLGIYEDLKRQGSLCNIFMYTEALDASLKWGNWTRVVDVLSDILDSGCELTAVTCTVVLMGLSSRCSTAEEASILIEFLRKYDSKLAILVRYLLLESVAGDAQVEALLDKLTEVLSPRNSRKWTIFSAGLIDALWVLGWRHRAATVFRWTLLRGFHECFCTLNNHEWKLDIRNLSVGSSMVAFYQWLKWLEEFACEADRRELVTDAEATEVESSTITGPPRKELVLGVLRGEMVLPFDRLLHTQITKCPQIVTVVTGVGKFSNPERGSLVREAVSKEVAKLNLPFKHWTGAWVAPWDSLRVWLRDEGVKITVSDTFFE